MQFIYCFDEDYKNELDKLGCKLIKTDCIDNKDCWIYENQPNIYKFNNLDKKKVLFSNKLNF